MIEIKISQLMDKLKSIGGEKVSEGKKKPDSAPAQNQSFQLADGAYSNYGIASVKINSAQSPKRQLTPQEVEKILKKSLKNDEYKISIYRELFSNLDKLDYSNIDRHLQNIQTMFNMNVNFPEHIVKNGYFYSEEGAQAFDALAEVLSPKSSKGFVSPLSIALSKYKACDVLTLKKRGLLIPSEIDKSKRLNKLAQMSDEEYAAFQKRVDESISKTGYSFKKLSLSLKKELRPYLDSTSLEIFEKKYLNPESVVPQKEILDLVKDFPIKIEDYSLLEVLDDVNIDNVDAYKTIIPQLKLRKDISTDNVSQLLDIVNSKTVNILMSLLQDDEIPISKILEYCDNDEFVQGCVSKDDVLNDINDDPFLKSVQAIKTTSIDLIPKNAIPKPLNPRDIDSSALALVHMTKYEPENGVILSTRDKLGGSRNSVHFTLNHAVSSHRFGSWEDCSCAIIMPYDSTVKLNGDGKFIEGMPNDLYTDGSVKIPEGSIIVKHNTELDEGSIDISEHPSIKGVKVIETSELPYDIVPYVIEKMGYSHLKADGPIGLFSYGTNNGKDIDAAMDNFASWKEFCAKQGLKATRHTGSAGEIAEKLIENISMLCVKNSWIGGENNKYDYRKDLFKYINYAKKLQQKGYFTSYNLEDLETIIKESTTPKEAVAKMPEKLGFHPTLEYDYFSACNFEIPIDIYSEWHEIEDSPKLARKYLLEKEMEYD